MVPTMCTLLILQDVVVGTALTCLELLLNHFLKKKKKLPILSQ